ncbi:MAG: hypothetical protein M3378_07805, partial [Actinomycetota bacterium]|nr:hypothetical protein [Actinomycetota bacterium]
MVGGWLVGAPPARSATGSGGGTGTWTLLHRPTGTAMCIESQMSYTSGPDYQGTYTDTATGQSYTGPLTVTMEIPLIRHGPSGSWAPGSCDVRGGTPITATVTSPGGEVSCSYTGTYSRGGPVNNNDSTQATIELEGTCTVRGATSGTHETQIQRGWPEFGPPSETHPTTTFTARNTTTGPTTTTVAPTTTTVAPTTTTVA